MADVYLFISQRDLAATNAFRDSVKRTCADHGWNFQARTLKPTKTPAGRPVLPIATPDAIGLYPRSHRSRVAVLVLGTDPVVPLRPNAIEAIRYRDTIPLRQYLDYKTCWIRVPNDPQNHTWAGVFEAWCERIECDDEHDPRCLPFHIFSGDGANLHDEAMRRTFNERYGAGARRTDDTALAWTLGPRDYHSNEVLTIAGYVCRPGFHWDVSREQRWRISTPAGVWEGKGHVNVYPDAHIRLRGNNARKTA